jgi:hypothetical protein
LGIWKNYDELESSLSIEELMITLSASREKESRDRKFQASLQGIDMEESVEEDITKIKGYRANEEGFGIGLGLGHIVEGG